jgi:predicted RND superfamily exporter protein
MLALIVLLVVGGGIFTSTHLKVGDSSAGGAVLYPDHPYNMAAAIMNEDFVGESRLIVVVKGKDKLAIKDRGTLETMERLGLFMEDHIENVGGTMSLTDLVRRINRNWHDGSPKWEMIPDHPKHLGQIFFLLASGMSPGEMDQYVSLPDYTHSNVTAFLRDYDHDVIKGAIAKVKEFAKEVDEDPESKVEIKLASGILGILAAVNEEVEWSYWAILVVIFSVTFMLCAITYRSFKTAFILLIPLYISQVLCELIMIFFHIDLNIDSLPVAAIGVGVGIDYAIYHMSRLKEESAYTTDLDKAILIALRTTGRIIIFTASTLAVGVIFWQFSALKFQAEMGLLILLLMLFNMTGALIFLPSLCAILRPKWVQEMGERMEAEEAA